MIRAIVLAFAVLALTAFAQPADAAVCKDQKKSICSSRSSCSWVRGYTRKDKVKVSSYCRKQFKARKIPPCNSSNYLACQRRKICRWVAGYKKSDGTRIKSFCRAR